MKLLNVPEWLPDNKEMFDYYKKCFEKCHSSVTRGAIINNLGQVIWEEDYYVWQARISKSSIIPKIRVIVEGKPLPSGMSPCIVGFIVNKRRVK